jgi:membrane protein implicated in regulation of membrane protease activity
MIPAWTAVLLFVVLVVKDVVMYPLVRRAYEPAPTPVERLVGARGIARQPLAPSGYVEVQGTLWRAEVVPGAASVGAGARVTVCGANGLTLLVAAEPAGSNEDQLGLALVIAAVVG